MLASTESELYQVFDLTYDYDLYNIFKAVINGILPMKRYLEMIRWQDAIFPRYRAKLRFIENHDLPRLLKSVEHDKTLAWIAFMSFLRGSFLIYAGLESENTHTPSLFMNDKVVWKNYPLQKFLIKLALLKKSEWVVNGEFVICQDEPVVVTAWQSEKGSCELQKFSSK